MVYNCLFSVIKPFYYFFALHSNAVKVPENTGIIDFTHGANFFELLSLTKMTFSSLSVRALPVPETKI